MRPGHLVADPDASGGQNATYPVRVKEFWIYTGLRVGLFLGSACIVFGIWFLVADEVNMLAVVVIAFLISGIASYALLAEQRNAFANRVAGRADRIVDRFDEMKAKEDDD